MTLHRHTPVRGPWHDITSWLRYTSFCCSSTQKAVGIEPTLPVLVSQPRQGKPAALGMSVDRLPPLGSLVDMPRRIALCAL